jgi:GWxTD domain-containing protein
MIHADFWRDFRSYGELATSSRGQWHCGRYENPVTDNFSGSSADLGWLADLNLLCPELFERNMARYFLPRSNLRRDDLAGLIAEFTLAFATDTTFARPLEALLGDLVYLERWAQADSIVQRLQAAFPDAAEPLLYFALVRHGLGDDRAASIAFSRGFGRMSDEHIRGYGDISQLLPPAQSARYATADTTQQAQFAAAYWNALDPLYLTPVNERRVAHYARVVAADLMFTAAATQVRGRDTFAGQIWIRYGRPLTMREVTLASGRLSFWDYGPGPDIAMTRATAYQGYRPTDGGIRRELAPHLAADLSPHVRRFGGTDGAPAGALGRHRQGAVLVDPGGVAGAVGGWGRWTRPAGSFVPTGRAVARSAPGVGWHSERTPARSAGHVQCVDRDPGPCEPSLCTRA